MNPWLVMLLAGLATFGMRLSFFFLFGRGEIPEQVVRILRYVPPAVFSAIVFPELLMPGGVVDVSLSNLRLIAGLIAALVAWRTRKILWTILAGMLSLWALQWFFGL